MSDQSESENGAPVNSGAKKKRNIRSKIVAASQQEGDIAVRKSKKCPLPPTDAPSAPTTPPKANRGLATFIVRKFVYEHLIEWGRDMVLACKFAKQYPNETFWRNFPLKRQVPSMAVIYTPEMRRRLKRIHDEYEERLEKQKNFQVDEPSKTWTIGEKCGEDFILPPKKQTLKEFLT